jgi:3-deoxy-D-manno-octulosonate 8-phosphate phosphatase (KDO 8-P phosphatase)
MMDKLKRIKLLAMDVDGVLTDGSIIFGPVGDIKAFNVLDGLGMNVAAAAGLEVAWITGNSSAAVTERASSLGVTEVHQGAQYKLAVLRKLAERKALAREEIAYIGDDLNDLPAFEVAGVRFAVANAAPEVKAAADFVTERPGGRGAVREVIEMILKAQSRWDDAVQAFLQGLRLGQEKANP